MERSKEKVTVLDHIDKNIVYNVYFFIRMNYTEIKKKSDKKTLYTTV